VTSIAILTPSYLPDLSGFRRLHESVLRFTDSDTMHHAIVPRRDLAAFQAIGSPRLRVWSEADFLPPGFLATDALAALRRRIPVVPRSVNCSAINLRRPWPPIRGWILQQVLKLSAATKLPAQAVVIIDSDVVLVRPMPADSYFRGETVRTYENPGGLTGNLPRHVLWTKNAHELLGLPWAEQDSYPDYVGGIVSWDPAVVRGCLTRIEAVTGRDWATAVTRYLHFSEFILYGTYLRHFGSTVQQSFCEPLTRCHSYWSPVPLTQAAASAFVESRSEHDFAVHIQSNSGTEQDLINRILPGPNARSTP
jgi:hypothetical protein